MAVHARIARYSKPRKYDFDSAIGSSNVINISKATFKLDTVSIDDHIVIRYGDHFYVLGVIGTIEIKRTSNINLESILIDAGKWYDPNILTDALVSDIFYVCIALDKYPLNTPGVTSTDRTFTLDDTCRNMIETKYSLKSKENKI